MPKVRESIDLAAHKAVLVGRSRTGRLDLGEFAIGAGPHSRLIAEEVVEAAISLR